MKNALFCTLAFLFLVPHAFGALPEELVGKYRMDVEDGDTMELRQDGTAFMAGDKTRWSAEEGRLTVGADVMGYTLQGNMLFLEMGPVRIAWKKLGGRTAARKPRAAAAKSAAKSAARNGAQARPPRKQAAAPGGGKDQDAQSREMLTSSAWCAFSYNQVSGASSTRRVVFRPDGVLLMNDGAESYSSGYGGIAAGQSSSSGALRWKLENQRLYVDSGQGYEDLDLTATRNSNGYVILRADGREYSMCK